MKNGRFIILGVLIGLTISGILFWATGLSKNKEFSYISPTYSPESNIAADTLLTNINTATIDELDKLPGIGPEKASAIVDFRETYGNFVSIEDLLYVPGIGQSLFDQLKDKIRVK